ncbi:MAG TPA: transporter substrate-binding domain-containing protein, partial [Candidatus Binatus sp.]|nr:transporter substrate-binding domain-containing protein [Candidatus Binatus sp.]
MLLSKICRLTLLGIFILAPSYGHAQSKNDQLRVATRLVQPFVFEANGNLTGFSVELWQEIAKQMNVKSDFVVKPTVKELLDAVKSKEAALGISAISITAERELELDFSQPMFDAGLQILTPVQGGHGASFKAIIANIFSLAVLPYVLAVGIILLTMAHLVWFLERRHPTGMLTDRDYFPGIFEACWWAASTLATQADQMPRAALARVIAVFWMFASVVFIAYFTAAVTSNLTVQQLHGDINGPEDLPGKRVASVRTSTASEYLRQHNVEAVEYAKVEDAYQALQDNQVDAVVYDAPVLLYYAAHEGNGKAQVVGAIFRKENYGIAFPSNDALRKPVNEALLKLKENGVYDQLYKKWFGS